MTLLDIRHRVVIKKISMIDGNMGREDIDIMGFSTSASNSVFTEEFKRPKSFEASTRVQS